MRHLKSAIHPDIDTIENKSIVHRKATRAIVLRGENILLLYTERYHDYSLPGGGLDDGEEFVSGMIRELSEETGAKNIVDVKEFGIYEEYRPWYKPEYDLQHIISFCFTCQIDEELGETSFEEHELSNGMKPMWININEAIAHNKETIASSPKKGMSIERETYLLELIKKELT